MIAARIYKPKIIMRQVGTNVNEHASKMLDFNGKKIVPNDIFSSATVSSL